MVFAAKGGIKNGAEGAVPPQWNGTSYLPRAEPSTRPGGVSRSRTEPLAPRAKGPAAPSTLTPVRACQPSGILESTAPIPIPTAPQAPEPSLPLCVREYSPSDICRLTASCLSAGGKRIAAGRQPFPNQRFHPFSHRALSGAGLLRCRRSRRWSPPEGCPGPGCRRRRLCPWVLLFRCTS